jgi:hypothetical protein
MYTFFLINFNNISFLCFNYTCFVFIALALHIAGYNNTAFDAM